MGESRAATYFEHGRGLKFRWGLGGLPKSFLASKVRLGLLYLSLRQ